MSEFSNKLKRELAEMDKVLESNNLSGEERYNKSKERLNKATELLAVIEDENAGNQYEME